MFLLAAIKRKVVAEVRSGCPDEGQGYARGTRMARLALVVWLVAWQQWRG